MSPHVTPLVLTFSYMTPSFNNVEPSYFEETAAEPEPSDYDEELSVEDGDDEEDLTENNYDLSKSASCFTQAEHDVIGGVMQDSIASGTQRGNAVNWKKWSAFIEPRGLDVYLTSINADDRIKMVVLFSAICKDHNWDFSAVITSMKHQFALAFQSSSFLNDLSVHKAAASVKVGTREQSVRALDNVKLLIPYDMISWIREKYFIEEPKNLTSMMIYLATAVSYTFGLRPSNLAHDSNTKGCHAVTAEYVTISVSIDGENCFLKGHEYNSKLPGLSPDMVTAISFTMLSSKSMQKTSLRNRPDGALPVSFTLTREFGGPKEIQLLEDLLMWIECSSRQSTDLFFSYKLPEDSKSGKKLTRAEMALAIKRAAVGCDLDPVHFSPKSTRKAYATELQGMIHQTSLVDKAMNKNWSKESSAISHYIGSSVACPNTLTTVDAGTNQSLVTFQLGNAIVLSHGAKKTKARSANVSFEETEPTVEPKDAPESDQPPDMKRTRQAQQQFLHENSI